MLVLRAVSPHSRPGSQWLPPRSPPAPPSPKPPDVPSVVAVIRLSFPAAPSLNSQLPPERAPLLPTVGPVQWPLTKRVLLEFSPWGALLSCHRPRSTDPEVQAPPGLRSLGQADPGGPLGQARSSSTSSRGTGLGSRTCRPWVSSRQLPPAAEASGSVCRCQAARDRGCAFWAVFASLCRAASPSEKVPCWGWLGFAG